MTRQVDGRPGPGLGGTGRLADDLYLIAHHEQTGRPHLQPRALGLGLAGALLAELILPCAIGIRADAVVAAAPARASDLLTERVAVQIAAESQQHPVSAWLAFLARNAASDVAARLAQAGYLAPALRWRPRRGQRWIPADPECAFAPVARVKSALDPTRPAPAWGVALAGLAVSCGLGARLGLYLPSGARTRTDALVDLLDPGLSAVIIQTQAAVDAALLAHRM